ncbi:hypothetical protein MERGE_000449 [Pneumocystis wakefieldiae]|uniref:4'-phosphopantetheinyl transferase domain-containing protein n=1 Tax=Pneumocystis wakefieldiae TaxID=38082 RepID=A0A899FUF4_9ASCO|nr:hypothetical protein MERGE_000449 [Pneumocystis wakefieldiae]
MIKILERRSRFIERICKRILRLDEQDIPHSNNKNQLALWISTKWAAKEAAFKAVNFQQKLKWKDIQICKYKNNQPYIQLWSEGKPTKKMKLSISHDGDYVVAFVAW